MSDDITTAKPADLPPIKPWTHTSFASLSYAKKFSGKYAHRIIKGGVEHNLPQEAPRAFAQAVVEGDGY